MDIMARRYDKHNYNCFHFAIDVWKLETGEDISFLLTGGRQRFQRVKRAVGIALALMHRPRLVSHIGVFVNGRILHLPEHGSPKREHPDIAMLGYKQIRYYKRKLD